MSKFAVNLTRRVAARGSDIVSPIPFNDWNEEQAEVHICQINLKAPIAAATRAYNILFKIEFLLARGYSHDEQHSLHHLSHITVVCY